MSNSDFYEATFRWPHLEANDVIVTGEFDGWSQSIHLPRTSSGFEGTVKIPWGRKVAYKYIVDGRWTTTDTQPTELDPIGNINNVYTPPARSPYQRQEAPPVAPSSETVSPESKQATVGSVNGIVSTAKQTAVSMAEAIAPGTTSKSEETEVSPQPATAPVSDVVPAVESVARKAAEKTGPSPDAVSNDQSLSSSSKSDPIGDMAVEAILPPSARTGPHAPGVPISILPLVTDSPSSPAVTDAPKETLKTAVVEGATTSADKPDLAEPFEGVSTHTAAVVNGGTYSAPPEIAAAVPLPPPTPAEAPALSAPTNGKTDKPAEVSSTTSSPASTPRKEKRMPFPSLGRHHRKSSSSADVSTHSEASTESPKGTVSSHLGSKKRTSSIFGRLRDMFHHDHENPKAEKEK